MLAAAHSACDDGTVEGIREGTILAGKYQVDRILGAGGMGMVVAATHTQLYQRVALKFMLPEALGDHEASERFLREARAAVKLQSEHVAKVLDVGTLDTGAPYIVMEYLEGCDLGAILQSRGQLPLEEVAEYVVHACDALAEAHAARIIHRDIKPGNLFVTRRPDGAPLLKVLDFGISKASTLGDSSPNALTKTATMLGTPLYMSPEQMKSARDVDARSDVWSLGIVLYEALCGRVPFDADTVGGLMAKVLVETPTAPRVLRADLPEPVASLVASCLEKDPAKRCPNVGEIAARLAPFAPPRARPIAERALGVLRMQPPSRADVASSALDSVGGAAPTGVATASSWAEGRDMLARRRGPGIRFVAALAGIAAAGVVVAAFSMRSSAPKAASTAATGEPGPAIALAASTAVAHALLPEPSSPPLPTTSTGGAASAMPAPPASNSGPPPPPPSPGKHPPRAASPAPVLGRSTADPPAPVPSSAVTPAPASAPAVAKPGSAGHKDDL